MTRISRIRGVALFIAVPTLAFSGCLAWRSPDEELSRFDQKQENRSFRAETPFIVSPSLFRPKENSAIVKAGQQAYLSLEVDFPPAAALRVTINDRFGTELKHRGEAHLTVVTPPELQKILASGLTIDEIKGIAQQLNLSAAKIDPVCLGMGRAKVASEVLRTFYVVVDSVLVRRFRDAIAKVLVSRGTDPAVFDPRRYFPHVSIGYTQRDLHEADGVMKDQSTCIAPLQVTAA